MEVRKTNLFDLSAKISLDTSDYERGISNVMTKARGMASGVGTALATIGKVGGVALGAAATGVGALTKSAIDSYGEFEQLAGGVNKLFGDEAAQTIMRYAIGAYETAGLSANEYMQQATSFSASLINSLGGDTQKAAELADVAMRSMSDNWNTFGTDVSAVQSAYQGFAKQNYTMLDNLKLGYGGTKTEMERLIDDANAYAESLGESGDLSIDSFADVVQAIELVQKKQNIYGTTSKEAATTIQGSIGMTKASWQNFVTALGNSEADVGYFMDNLISSIGTTAQNILPVVRTALSGISSMIGELAPMIATELPGLITDIVPPLVTAAGQILIALGQGLMENAPVLMQSAIDLILQFADYLAENADSIVDGAVTLIITLMNGLVENAPKLASAAIRVVTSFANAIIRNAPKLFESVKQAIRNVLTDVFGVDESTADSFIGVLQTIWDTVSNIIDSIKGAFDTVGTALSDLDINWSEIWNGIGSVISTVGDGICVVITAVGDAIAWVIDWLQDLGTEANTEGTFLNDLWTGIQDAFGAAVEFIQTAWDTFVAWFQEKIELVQSVFAWLREQMDTEGSTIALIWDSIQSTIETVITVITDIFTALTAFLQGDFEGAWNAIQDAIGAVWDNIKTQVTNAINIVKNTLSSVMDTIKTNISDKWNTIKTNVSDKMTSIKTGITDKWNSIKTTVSDKVTSIKNKITDTFESAKNTAKDKFQAMKDGIKNKLESAKTAIQNVVDRIKGIFNFTWSFPHIKLPHFSWTWLDLGGVVSIPQISVSWYKKAYDNPYLFTKPTLAGFGDGVGGEMVYGKDSLMRDIREAVRSEQGAQPITINVYAARGQDERQIAVEVQKALTNLMARQRAGAIA